MGGPPGDGPDDQFEEDRYRRRLYRILSTPGAEPDSLLEDLLSLGRDRLGVENGYVARVDPDAGSHEIVAASGSDLVVAGDRTDLAETFCREAVTAEGVLTIVDADSEGWGDDPARRKWGIRCYIGSRVAVRDGLYGTVCFVGETPRADPFEEDERTFVDLLARAVSQVLEREAFDRTLREREELFQLFVDEVEDYAIFVLDRTGQVATWNSGARNLKGYTADEVVGEHFSLFYPEAARERGRPARLLDEARENGRVEDEGWRVRADGSRFWALVSITALHDDDGELRGFGKVTRDLTERRAAEQRLAAEKAFVERALDSLEDVFFVMDTDGTLRRVNERAQAVTGHDESALLEMEPASLFVPSDRPAVEAAIQQALQRGETTVEATLVADSGERRRYEFRARRLTDEAGEVTGIVGIGRDVTERQLYEQRLEVAQRVLRHNLRNELNVVRGWAESLAERVAGSDREIARRIVDTTDSLVELTEKSRLLTELDTSRRATAEPLDVTRTVDRVLDELRAAHPDAVIEADLPESLTVAVADADRFALALANAVENAVEHNPTDEPWVAVSADREDGTLRVTVDDECPAIPEEERQVLQEGEEPLQHGSGVGLWLVHWCTTVEGGGVRFEEREGGNRLVMSFPVGPE